ncbi:MAG: carboxylating nicotinate-nucleotide diphosphorylase [Methanospirillum sp.]|uniref:carboxylating nicotinate-nucleotide diphosphorylase n=1 Tax=Methanospirillum sp. TaxID=45200 RepID=UPI00236BE4D4|nr:carboxylating nicotinate-nucleotide diphosphorylase [Methanospirillum sp.]MDD1728095.1 carboxylating nicotinate-nucleotide diphosphorylase [Methanospirillum sp.]
MRYPEVPIHTLLRFIEEDAPFGDITSEFILDKQSCLADIIAKEDAILAGLSEISRLFRHYGVETSSGYEDGNSIASGTVVLSLTGDAHAILLVERTALNLMGRMSGIASQTRKIQELVSSINPCCRIAATRKTAPGLRLLDKKAAMIGGADPHRFSLSDAILIKDTHRVLIPLGEAIKRAKTAGIYHLIEVEAESSEEAAEAAQAGADMILLDNMSPEQISSTLTLLKTHGLRDQVMIELSGGITPDNITWYAALKVDRISLGMLTHTVRNADFSLEIRPGSNVL